jgi:DNA polymerase I
LKLVTIDEFEREGKAFLSVVTRDETGRHVNTISTNEFKPYFYAPTEAVALWTGSEYLPTIDGKYAVKMEFDSYNAVKPASQQYERSFEADVHYTTRYLIDMVPKIEQTKLRIHYTDIEKDVISDRLISIAVYDNYLEKCIVFVWREDLKEDQYDKEYSFASGYKFNATVHTYGSERALLRDYIAFIQQTDPDILTGWFFVSFDSKEIINEIKKVGLDPSDLSPIGRAYMIGENVTKHKGNIAIKGRVLWDTLEAYSGLQQSRLPSKSLEAIAQKELGEGKAKHRNFKEIWKDIDELVEYNCKDSMLVYRIDQKKKLLEYYDTLRRFVGCDWSALHHETLLWDVYILRKVHGQLVLPTKRAINIESAEGATVVKPPKKGIYQNILLTDFMRLYPSAIITFNMSPETLVRGKPNPETDYILPNGFAFRKEPIGLLPSVLLELLDLRKEYKKQMRATAVGSDEYNTLDNMQYAVKVLMNALYGAMGYFNFRLATPEIVASTTLIGRLALKRKMEIIEQLAHEVMYGDTDSVFIKSNKTELSDMIEELTNMVRRINIGVTEYFEEELGARHCSIETEAKAIYKNLIISAKKSGEGSAKKRYAGLRYWVDGQTLDIDSDEALEIKGYEQKRSDTSELSRDLQKNLFKILLKSADKDQVKDLIQTVVEGIKKGRYSLDYIGISKGIKDLDDYATDNPHRRGSIYANKYLDGHFGMGDKPKIIYVSSCGKYPKTDVVAFNTPEDVPKDFNIDTETVIAKTVIIKVEHILDSAGFSMQEILTNTKSLEMFF